MLGTTGPPKQSSLTIPNVTLHSLGYNGNITNNNINSNILSQPDPMTLQNVGSGGLGKCNARIPVCFVACRMRGVYNGPKVDIIVLLFFPYDRFYFYFLTKRYLPPVGRDTVLYLQ